MSADHSWVNGLKVVELKDELKQRGLPVSGSKAVLQERLLQFLREQDSAGADAAEPDSNDQGSNPSAAPSSSEAAAVSSPRSETVHPTENGAAAARKQEASLSEGSGSDASAEHTRHQTSVTETVAACHAAANYFVADGAAEKMLPENSSHKPDSLKAVSSSVPSANPASVVQPIDPVVNEAGAFVNEGSSKLEDAATQDASKYALASPASALKADTGEQDEEPNKNGSATRPGQGIAAVEDQQASDVQDTSKLPGAACQQPAVDALTATGGTSAKAATGHMEAEQRKVVESARQGSSAAKQDSGSTEEGTEIVAAPDAEQSGAAEGDAATKEPAAPISHDEDDAALEVEPLDYEVDVDMEGDKLGVQDPLAEDLKTKQESAAEMVKGKVPGTGLAVPAKAEMQLTKVEKENTAMEGRRKRNFVPIPAFAPRDKVTLKPKPAPTTAAPSVKTDRPAKQQKVETSQLANDVAPAAAKTSSESGPSAVRVDGFVRPLREPDVKQLMDKYGTLKDLWMPTLKTHCYAIYAEAASAGAVVKDLMDNDWQGLGNRLNPKLVDVSLAESAISNGRNPASRPAAAAKPAPPKPAETAAPKTAPVFVPIPDPTASSRAASTPTAPPPRQTKAPAARAVREDPPPLTLDDLFRKTDTKPRLYWLPLTDEEVAAKRAQRAAAAAQQGIDGVMPVNGAVHGPPQELHRNDRFEDHFKGHAVSPAGNTAGKASNGVGRGKLEERDMKRSARDEVDRHDERDNKRVRRDDDDRRDARPAGRARRDEDDHSRRR